MSKIQEFKSQAMIAPSYEEVRRRIEMVGRDEVRDVLKGTLILGAARIGELCGRLHPGDTQKGERGRRKLIVYGPRGTDLSFAEFQVQNIDVGTAVRLLNKEITMEEAMPKIKVALFRINIEKRHLEPGEAPHSRVVALPYDDRYEPWTKDLVKAFERAGEDYVFPFTRQYVWEHLTYREPVFEGLSYPVEKYRVKMLKSGRVEVKVCHRHLHVNKNGDPTFKTHGIRHVMNNHLFDDCHFEGLDYAAFMGWSLRQLKTQDPNIPTMVTRYAQIYENWRRYFPKTLVLRVV